MLIESVMSPRVREVHVRAVGLARWLADQWPGEAAWEIGDGGEACRMCGVDSGTPTDPTHWREHEVDCAWREACEVVALGDDLHAPPPGPELRAARARLLGLLAAVPEHQARRLLRVLHLHAEGMERRGDLALGWAGRLGL